MIHAEIHTETQHRLVCPECKTVGSTIPASLRNRQFGPWYCDNCGVGVTGKVDADGVVWLDTDTNKRKNRTLVLLRLRQPLADGSVVHVVTEGMHFPDMELEIGQGDEYFYNEHTCPTNWMRGVSLFDGTDEDPHGLFQWVATIAMPSQEQWEQIIDTSQLGHPDNWKGNLDHSNLDWDTLTKLFGVLPHSVTLLGDV